MRIRGSAFQRQVAATCAASCLLALSFTASAGAQKVDGVPDRGATAPVNLQLTPTDAFMRIRGWSLPAPVLPLAIMGSWGGRGTVSGDGAVNIPVGQISDPKQFQFQRDINGEDETMTVSLYRRGDWTGQVNPLNGEVVMHLPMTLKIEAHHVRMVNPPWPINWIYGNIECTVPLDFGPMTTAVMTAPDPSVDPVPVTKGTPYSAATGQFSVINNSMTIGGFNCSHPDIGAGKVEDELNGAVAIPSPPGRADAKFNLTFLEGGDVVRPQPAIRPNFVADPVAPLAVAFDAGSTYAKTGVRHYIWDFDGDGQADEKSLKPKLTHGFPAAGVQKVGLRIIDGDGDGSGWTSREVTLSADRGSGAGPGANPGEAKAKLARPAISPKSRTVRPGRKVRFKARIRSIGGAAARGVRLCVKVPKRLARIGKKCRLFGDLAAGKARTVRVTVKVRARTAPRRFRLKARVSAANVPVRSGAAWVYVTAGTRR